MKCIVVFLCNKIHTFNTILVLCFLIQFLYKTILDISVVHMCTFVSFLFAFSSLTAGRQCREVILSFCQQDDMVVIMIQVYTFSQSCPKSDLI